MEPWDIICKQELGWEGRHPAGRKGGAVREGAGVELELEVAGDAEAQGEEGDYRHRQPDVPLLEGRGSEPGISHYPSSPVPRGRRGGGTEWGR